MRPRTVHLSPANGSRAKRHSSECHGKRALRSDLKRDTARCGIRSVYWPHAIANHGIVVVRESRWPRNGVVAGINELFVVVQGVPVAVQPEAQ